MSDTAAMPSLSFRLCDGYTIIVSYNAEIDDCDFVVVADEGRPPLPTPETALTGAGHGEAIWRGDSLFLGEIKVKASTDAADIAENGMCCCVRASDMTGTTKGYVNIPIPNGNWADKDKSRAMRIVQALTAA